MQDDKKFTGGVISPGGFGYDINRGVRLIRTNLMEKDIKPKLPQLIGVLFDAIPSGLGSRGQLRLRESELNLILVEGMQWVVRNGYGWLDKDLDVCEENGCVERADPSRVSDFAERRGTPQLGSLGSGNHFLEIQASYWASR